MNNEDKKERFTLWMKHSTFEKVEENYREDNCQKKSEFIENAVNFYCGYLKMNSSEPFLSTVLRETLKKLIKASDDRISILLFKIAVELAITMTVVADNQCVNKCSTPYAASALRKSRKRTVYLHLMKPTTGRKDCDYL